MSAGILGEDDNTIAHGGWTPSFTDRNHLSGSFVTGRFLRSTLQVGLVFRTQSGSVHLDERPARFRHGIRELDESDLALT